MHTNSHTQRGKWSQAGVPKKGWSCVGVDDLEEPQQLCQMCESIEIRYVHIMEHPDYVDQLQVGCVCAEHMEEDYKRPREREQRLKKAAKRRTSWANRTWRVSRMGNPYLNVEGFNLVIYARQDKWSVNIKNRASGITKSGRKLYSSVSEAKIGALNALLWAKEYLK
ncbi:hypothetical protein [Acetobacter senegalensis]|uniref:hypothetical protein n=1 Tax=Acetobacter senegalensis TaxID=446692 RepID=UPI0009ED685B|nr:hypothetical protein [Acetobacter senegalensis]